MEQLTKNQAVATSQEAVQNQNEPQLRDENAHNDKSVHGVLNPTYQAGLRRDAVQPDIGAERKKRDEIESNQIKQLIRNGRSASLQRTFKKSFTSFSHSTRNKTRDGLIRVRNIRALNGRFNT